MKKLWLLLILPVYLVYLAYKKYKWRNSITTEDCSKPIQLYTMKPRSDFEEELRVDVPGFMKMKMTLLDDEYEITFDYFNSSQNPSMFIKQRVFMTGGYIEICDEGIWLPFEHRSFERGDDQTRSDDMYVDDYEDMSWNMDDVVDALRKVYSDVEYTIERF